MRTLGAILAGGGSTRFGSDKAEALLAGHRLLDHALAALHPQVDAVVIVGRDMQGFPTVADWPRPGMGPLGGIAGALHLAAAEGFDRLLSISVDCVRLPDDVVALLSPAPAFLDSQPVIGLWPVTAIGELETLLTDGQDLAVRAFARRIGARAVQSDFVPPNINSAADLSRLAQR